MGAARKWYSSREYQGIVQLRTNNTISDPILVDPVASGFTSAASAGQLRDAIASGDAAGRNES